MTDRAPIPTAFPHLEAVVFISRRHLFADVTALVGALHTAVGEVDR